MTPKGQTNMATGLSRKKAPIASGDTDSTEPLKQKFNFDLYHAGIMGILKTHKLVGENANTNSSPELLQAITEFDESNGIPIEAKFSNAVDAINAFEAWIMVTDWYYTEPVLYTTNSITVTLTMPANSGSISVAMQVTPKEEVELDIVIADVKLKLQQAITSAFPRQSSNQGDGTKPAKTEQKTVKTESFNVSHVVVGNFKGQRTVRLIPSNGRWKEYGIPIYDDMIEELEFEVPEEEGEYEFKGRMTYEMKDNDKPSRVVRVSGEYI